MASQLTETSSPPTSSSSARTKTTNVDGNNNTIHVRGVIQNNTVNSAPALVPSSSALAPGSGSGSGSGVFVSRGSRQARTMIDSLASLADDSAAQEDVGITAFNTAIGATATTATNTAGAGDGDGASRVYSRRGGAAAVGAAAVAVESEQRLNSSQTPLQTINGGVPPNSSSSSSSSSGMPVAGQGRGRNSGSRQSELGSSTSSATVSGDTRDQESSSIVQRTKSTKSVVDSSLTSGKIKVPPPRTQGTVGDDGGTGKAGKAVGKVLLPGGVSRSGVRNAATGGTMRGMDVPGGEGPRAWSESELAQLYRVQLQTPLSDAYFWDVVASNMPNRSATECQEKWFEVSQIDSEIGR